MLDVYARFFGFFASLLHAVRLVNAVHMLPIHLYNTALIQTVLIVSAIEETLHLFVFQKHKPVLALSYGQSHAITIVDLSCSPRSSTSRPVQIRPLQTQHLFGLAQPLPPPVRVEVGSTAPD